MGTFTVDIEVGDLKGQRSEALVDTGTSYLVVTRQVLARLGVPAIDPVRQQLVSVAGLLMVEYTARSS